MIAAVRVVPVETHAVSHRLLFTVSTQYWYEVVEVLAPHDNVRASGRAVWLLVGLVFANAPGSGGTKVVKVHATFALAATTPMVLRARTCHS